jgi:hypothetical protein
MMPHRFRVFDDSGIVILELLGATAITYGGARGTRRGRKGDEQGDGASAKRCHQ